MESGCIYTIVIRRLVEKLYPDKYDVIQWNIQARNITTNIKVNIYFTLPILSAMNVVIWKCYVDDYDKGRYDMILGQDILIELVFNI